MRGFSFLLHLGNNSPNDLGVVKERSLMRNIGVLVSYDGTAYSGFQIQPNEDTIQGRIEKAIYKLTKEVITIIASGRTDAGVHAYGQVCNFLTQSVIPIDRWTIALNSILPDDIVIRDTWEAPLSFHSRYSSKRKTYLYTILAEKKPDVFRRLTQFFYPKPLNIYAMQQAVTHLIGRHDFTSFTSSQSMKGSNIRVIYRMDVKYEPSETGEEGRGRIHLIITGSGFLYNMVRIITGTLIKVGQGKLAPDDIPRILMAKNRQEAGFLAPPNGLMLWSVEYSDDECQSL